MEFRNLVTFLKVAELRNFSKAAEKLGYSQSAVTVQIQQLEKELGVQLFERIGKGVLLTEKGKEFVFHANEVIRAEEKAIAAIRSDAAEFSCTELHGTLHIGSIESISTDLLPELLLQFHKTCPNVEIIVHTKGRDPLIDEVRNNNVDLFFTMEKKRTITGLKRLDLMQEKIVFAAPARFSALGPQSLSMEELVQLPFILTEQGESYRYELDRILSEHNLEINPLLEISNTETIAHLVESGMGVSFIPLFSIKKALARGTVTLLHTDFPEMRVSVQLFYHKNKLLTPQMKVFLSIVQEALKENLPLKTEE